HAQAGVSQAVVGQDDAEEAGALATGGGEDAIEVGLATQACATRQCGSASVHDDPCGSGDQALATLGATGIDDLATVGRRHAGTESVRACALQVTWLESAFHD